MQSNANSPKEWGLKINSQVRCFKLVTGTKQDGNLWGFFTYVEKDKDTKKALQKYNLWLVNDYNFLANFPKDSTVDVRIDSIQSIKPIWNTYNDKTSGQKVTERIINVEVVVSIVNVINNNSNNNYNYNNNGYNNNNGYQQPQNQQQGYQQQPNPYQNNPTSFDVDKKPNYNEPLPTSDDIQKAYDDMGITDMDLPF